MAGASRLLRDRQGPGRVPPLHLVAMVAYVGVLVAELPRLGEQLRANSDVASVLLLGDSLAAGTAGRPIEAGQPAYAWLVAALHGLGHVVVLWSVLPLAITWVGLAAIVAAVGRASGRWSAGLALALGIGAAPAVLLTELAPAFHGMAWGAVGLLGWCVVAMAVRGRPSRRMLLLWGAAGVLTGAVAASDALTAVAGLLPLAFVAVVVFVRSREPGTLISFGAILTGAIVSFTALHLYMASAGYSSGLGGGSTRGVGATAIGANARVVGRGLLDMANGLPVEPGAAVSPLPLALAALLIAVAGAGMVGVAIRELARARLRPGTAVPAGAHARQAHVAYWSCSALFLLAALVASNVIMPGGDAPPSDRLISSQRYVTGLFFAAVALIPLWATTRSGRALATALATLFVTASAVRVVAAAANADFQPAASHALPALARALQAHGLSHGYASYWNADVLRLSSSGGLDVVPAAEGTQCGAAASFCRELLNSAGGWFVPRSGRSFVVVDPGDTFIPSLPPESLGTPVESFTVNRFTVVVYPSDVLARFATSCAGRADHDCAG